MHTAKPTASSAPYPSQPSACLRRFALAPPPVLGFHQAPPLRVLPLGFAGVLTWQPRSGPPLALGLIPEWPTCFEPHPWLRPLGQRLERRLNSPDAVWYPDVPHRLGSSSQPQSIGVCSQGLLFPGDALAFAAGPTDNPQASAFASRSSPKPEFSRRRLRAGVSHAAHRPPPPLAEGSLCACALEKAGSCGPRPFTNTALLRLRRAKPEVRPAPSLRVVA